MKSPAVFLDRDGTIIEDRHYLADPEEVRLLPEVEEAIRSFAEAGYLVMIVSNQSGVARGLFTEEDLARVHARVETLLKDNGASLDAAYYCPYFSGDDAKVEAFRRESELRKPKPGMLLQAAKEHDVDLSRSWMIGDKASDIEAGARAGCRTILIQPSGTPVESNGFHPSYVVSNLSQAVTWIVREAVNTNQDEDTSAKLGDKSLRLLERLSTDIERMSRPRKQRDFSVLLMVATLVQMLVVMVGLWGLIALYNDQGGAATTRFSLACLLQIGALAAWLTDRFR